MLHPPGGLRRLPGWLAGPYAARPSTTERRLRARAECLRLRRPLAPAATSADATQCAAPVETQSALIAAPDPDAAVHAFKWNTGSSAVQVTVEAAPGAVTARLERQSIGLDATVGDPRRDGRLGVRRKTQFDAAVGAFELHAPFRHRGQIHVDTAVGGRGLDRPADITRPDAAVGGFGVDAPGHPGDFNAAVHGCQAHLAVGRNRNRIFDLPVRMAEEPGGAALEMCLDLDAIRGRPVADLDASERLPGRVLAGRAGNLRRHDL